MFNRSVTVCTLLFRVFRDFSMVNCTILLHIWVCISLINSF